MERLTRDELIDRVLLASRLSIYDRPSVEIWADHIIDYMIEAGVNKQVIFSNKSIGAVCIGVNDSRIFASGNVVYSTAFKERVIQLSCVDPNESEE